MKQTSKFTRYLVVMVMIGLLLGSGLPMATAAKNAPVRMVPHNFSALAETVSPAVVHIRVVKTVKSKGPALGPFNRNPFGDNEQFRDFFGHRFGPQRRPEFKQPGLGSGFIIDKTGYIVTNNHVVDGADSIKVILKDETEYNAEVIGRDPVTDIALIKIEAKHDLRSRPNMIFPQFPWEAPTI
ncbi:MAG: trypsin-like peptidase domain-containing protein [Deltaproteobacteria bacterium]|nr:trypsin-like peptidase domain-containing protein [Deltaproteobacteria bacterium]